MVKHAKHMFLACAHGDREKVKELHSKYGAELLDVKEPTKGTTPLHFAVIAGKAGVVKTLIKLGCDINAVSKSGDSALHLAVLKDKEKIAKLLIVKGIDVHIVNDEGKTAFQILKLKREAAARKKGAPSHSDIRAANGDLAESASSSDDDDAEDDGADGGGFGAALMSDFEAASAPARLRRRGAARRPSDAGMTGTRAVEGDDDDAAFDDGPYEAPFPVVTDADQPTPSIKRLRSRIAPRARAFGDQSTLRPSDAPKVVLSIQLPNGSRKKIAVPSDYTGQELINVFSHKIGLAINDMFELVVLSPKTGRIHMFIDADRTVDDHQLKPNDIIAFRTKFFKFPAGTIEPAVLELLYSQTRNDLTSGLMHVAEGLAVNLAALSLQVTHGNFNPKVHNLGFLSDTDLESCLPPRLAARYSLQVWQDRFFAVWEANEQDLPPQVVMATYLETARAAPAFGATHFEGRGPGGVATAIGVVEDGVLVRVGDQPYSFYSLFRRTPGSSESELKSWRWEADTVVFEVVDGPTADGPSAISFTVADDDAARELIELISGYYILLVCGDAVPTRPLLNLEDLPVPVEPLPLRTVMAPPRPRAADHATASRLEYFLEEYLAQCATDHVAPIGSVLAPLHAALDFGSDLTLLNLGVAAPAVVGLAATADVAADAAGRKMADAAAASAATDAAGPSSASKKGSSSKREPACLFWTAKQASAVASALKKAARYDDAVDMLRLSHVSFAGSQFGAGGKQCLLAVERILSALAGSFSVESVDLSNCGLDTDKLWASIGGSLRSVAPLGVLNISDNAMPPKGMVEFTRLFKRETHVNHTIIAARCGLTDEHIVVLGKRLYNDSTGLATLDISGNAITDFGLDQGILANMGRNSTLRELGFSRNNITSKGVKSFLALVAEKRSITSLRLSNCHISAKDCDVFAARLAANSVRTLALGGNSLAKGVPAIVAPLATSSAITELDLSDVSLEKNGVAALVDAIPATRNLKVLSLASNSLSSKDGVALITAIGAARALASVDLSNNSFKKPFAEALGPALAASTSLRSLSLAGNKLGSDGAVFIGRALAANGLALTDLDLASNKIGSGVDALAEGLESNSTLVSLSLADNSISGDHFLALIRSMELNTGIRHLNLVKNQKFSPAAIDDLIEPMAIGSEVYVTFS